MEYTIYKIYCKDENIKECYIGSTKNLDDRIKEHQRKCNNPKCNIKVYKFIRENGGFNNWNFVEIEKTDKENRFIRERFWIDSNSNLNEHIPTRTLKEYKYVKKDYISNRSKNYYENNKNKLLNSAYEYRKINQNKIKEKFNCECGGRYTRNSKSIHLKTSKHINYMNTHL